MGDTDEVNAKEVIEVDKEEQPTDAATEEEGKKRKAISPRSDAWEHFSKVKTEGGEDRAKCRYCSKLFRYDTRTNGTSSLKGHLKVCKKNPNKLVIDNQGTLQLQPCPGNSSVGTVSTWRFDLDDLKNSFAEMIIEDEQPFVLSERSGLRKFLAKACPRFVMPSRRSVTRNCVKVYDVHKEKLKNFLKENCSRACLTTDTWTSNTNQNYMCVTLHFIDNDWKLHKRIIGFFLVKGHRGEDIGKSLDNCLAEWGIDKVCTITVDNANANKNAIKYMKRVLNESKGSIAEGEYLHMRCVAHIINLIVMEGLKEIDISVKCVREAVKFIKGGTSRFAKFKKCAELAKYEKAFERYSDEDPYYKLDLEGEDGRGVPDIADWQKARKMAEFLEHFYELTLRVSATSHPTSHTYFHEIADVLVLLREWCKSKDKLCSDMGKRMLVKYYKYWGNRESEKGDQMLNLVMFFCVAIDPRYKLSNYIKMATFVMFGDEVGETLWAKVNTSFHALFEEYNEMYGQSDKTPQPSDSQEEPSLNKRLMRSLIAQQMSSSGGCNVIVKSELDKYLSEDNEEDRKGGRTLDEFRSSLTPAMVERLICTNDWIRGFDFISVEENLEELTKLEEEFCGLTISKGTTATPTDS